MSWEFKRDLSRKNGSHGHMAVFVLAANFKFVFISETWFKMHT